MIQAENYFTDVTMFALLGKIRREKKKNIYIYINKRPSEIECVI